LIRVPPVPRPLYAEPPLRSPEGLSAPIGVNVRAPALGGSRRGASTDVCWILQAKFTVAGFSGASRNGGPDWDSRHRIWI